MPGKFEYKKLSKYPHMKPIDVHLWEKLIEARPKLWDTVDYDVLVGTGVVLGDIKTNPYARDFKMLTQKKIDAVAYKQNIVSIIEVKPIAGSGAFGQVLTYKKLWTTDHPEVAASNIEMVVVTNAIQSDFRELYEDAGIILIEIGVCNECAGNLVV